MMRASALLTGAAAVLAVGVLSANALPTDGARLAGPHIGPSAAVEHVQYSSGRCFRQCIAGRRHRSCQIDVQGNKENCCAQRCRRRW